MWVRPPWICDDRDFSQEIGVEDERVRQTPEPGQEILLRQLFEPDRRPAAPAGRRHQAQPRAARLRAARAGGAIRVETGPLDVVRRDPRIEEHVRQSGGLRRGIPAVDVQGRIRLGDAFGLHPRKRGRELLAVFERGQDVIRRAVHDAAKAADLHRGQRFAHEVEDRNPVHHGAFEQERHAVRPRDVRQVPERERHRPFVGGDDVTAGLERGTDVVDRGLAGLDIERRRFDQHAKRRGAPGERLQRDRLGSMSARLSIGPQTRRRAFRHRRFAGPRREDRSLPDRTLRHADASRSRRRGTSDRGCGGSHAARRAGARNGARRCRSR